MAIQARKNRERRQCRRSFLETHYHDVCEPLIVIPVIRLEEQVGSTNSEYDGMNPMMSGGEGSELVVAERSRTYPMPG